jgi:hypothetical protein
MDAFEAQRWAGVVSSESQRFQAVDEQGWDASCGYAALASLLRLYRGSLVDESALLAQGSTEGGAVVKVSLAALAGLARQAGFETRAWRAEFERLATLLKESAPLLVHYDRPQGHFALLLAAGPDGVVTADPARGLELLTRAQFLARWSGVVLEVFRPGTASEGGLLLQESVRKAKARSAVLQRALSKPPGKQYFDKP